MTTDNTSGTTSSNTTGSRQMSVKLYPPIAQKVDEMNIPNFNHLVNAMLAERFGIDPMVVDAYRRNIGGNDADS